MQKLLVSEPSLTNFEEFACLAKEVWESGMLTHNGPKVQELEKKLKDKWNIPYLSLVTNGTVALEIGIRALQLPEGSGIITTAFTWIATASSIVWQKHIPIFIDIDPETFNIDPKKIEKYLLHDDRYSSIRVSAILAVHVFSNPCDVESIDEISKKYRLGVIYDGAHAVNVQYKGRDLSQWGDITTHSYHATKLYNSGEGGSIITRNFELSKRIERLRFFGHDDDKNIVHEGTNGKMHEISACIGLANLKMIDTSLNHRRELTHEYLRLLKETPIKFQLIDANCYNYSYCPMLFETEDQVVEIVKRLNEIGVIGRRYFYPSVNEFSIFPKQSCPISEDISKRIICVPCHDRVTFDDVQKISNVINNLFE